MDRGRLAAFPPAGNSKLPPASALAMEAAKSVLRSKAAAAEPARGGVPLTGGRPGKPWAESALRDAFAIGWEGGETFSH